MSLSCDSVSVSNVSGIPAVASLVYLLMGSLLFLAVLLQCNSRFTSVPVHNIDCSILIFIKTHPPRKVELYVTYTFICRRLTGVKTADNAAKNPEFFFQGRQQML